MGFLHLRWLPSTPGGAAGRDELKFLLNEIEVFQPLTLSTAVYYSDAGVKRVEENILGCLDSRTSLYLFT